MESCINIWAFLSLCIAASLYPVLYKLHNIPTSSVYCTTYDVRLQWFPLINAPTSPRSSKPQSWTLSPGRLLLPRHLVPILQARTTARGRQSTRNFSAWSLTCRPVFTLIEATPPSSFMRCPILKRVALSTSVMSLCRPNLWLRVWQLLCWYLRRQLRPVFLAALLPCLTLFPLFYFGTSLSSKAALPECLLHAEGSAQGAREGCCYR